MTPHASHPSSSVPVRMSAPCTVPSLPRSYFNMCTASPVPAAQQQHGAQQLPQEEAAGMDSSPHAACSYAAWHKLFRAHALRSIVVPLPQDFVSFLLEDGVFVGDASKALPTRGEDDDSDEEGIWQTPAQPSATVTVHSEGESSENEEDEEEQQDWAERFPELLQQVQAAIEELGGKVVPKLNWSCPSDATWVNPMSSLACDNAEQVVLMLKSSDRIAHDLELLAPAASTASPAAAAAAAAGPVTPVLVLRKWYDLRPEREWRCFVRGGDLVGVCQRDATQHFPQLALRGDASTGSVSGGASRRGRSRRAEAGQGRGQGGSQEGQQGPGDAQVHQQVHPQEEEQGQAFDWHEQLGDEAVRAAELLEDFHERAVRGRFPLPDYTYDAYVATNGTVKLVDFNPVGGTTNPLLFSWEELGLGQAAAAAAAETAAASGAGDADAGAADGPGSGAEAGPGSASESEDEDEEDDDEGDVLSRVQVRIVPSAAMVQPGQRAACAMPYDMLSVKETVEDMVRLMQQHGH